MRNLLLILLLLSLGSTLYSEKSDQIDLTADSAILLDYTTGEIFYNKAGNKSIPPASMTKVITLYLAYEYILENNFDYNTVIEIGSEGSAFSRPAGSSLMGLEEGQHVTYLELMQGLAVASGNDAAYALAHFISGDSNAFVEKMNKTCAELGFREFQFVDPDGWSENNIVTAESYARFCRLYIQNYPQALNQLHSVTSFTHPRKDQIPPGARIITPRTKKNTNILLGKVDGVDGLKTGYIPESGFNFTATALRNSTRFIAVIMGVHRESYYNGLKERAKEAAELLEYGFSHFNTFSVSQNQNILETRIWKGSKDFLQVQPEISYTDTLPIGEEDNIIAVYRIISEKKAPVYLGQSMGEISLYNESLLFKSDLISRDNIDKGSFTKRLKDSIKLLLKKMK